MINPSAFSLDTALINLSNAFSNLKLLVIAISYVIGVFFIVIGIMKYRIFANQTFGSAQRGEMAGPLVYIMIGAILCYYPSTVQTSLQTVFGSTDISPASDLVGYMSVTGAEKWRQIGDVVIEYMYLIGLIAFTRGWVILSKLTHSSGQPGSVGKGMIHIIGGILLINLVDTINILAATFGYTGS